jgi:DNA-binding IclR family transcriptional regulator
VGDRPDGVRLGELAAAVSLPKATAHRIVAALVGEQLLWTDAAGRIWLGSAIGRLAAASSAGLVARLHPLLVALGAALGETVDLSVPDGDRMRFVDQVVSDHRLRAVSAVGSTFPLHCTANGKALLAALPAARVDALLVEPLPRFTGHTIVDRRELLDELDRVRSEGVARDRQEHASGISALGVVVDDGAGPVAAISVPVPSERFDGLEDRIEDALRATGRRATGLLAGGGTA